MSALRLEVETHIVTASSTAVQNLTKCVAAAGVKIDELVVDSLASAEAVLSETEKELGVAVADFGAGTIDLALFQDGSPFHTRVLPVGGANVTNDVAIGLKTSIQVAEDLKIQHGTCDLRQIDEDEQISVSVLGEDAGRTVSRLEVSQIIEARMRETFELLRNEIRAAGVGMLPAGIVLTGGAAQLAGAAELGREVLQMPVRIAAPAGIGGLVDTLLTPGYSTAVGLLQWGATASPRASRTGTNRPRPVAASAGCATRSGASSRRDARADGPNGERPRAARPDGGVRGLRRRGRRRWRRPPLDLRPACHSGPGHRRDRRGFGRRPDGRPGPPAATDRGRIPPPPWVARPRRGPRPAAPRPAVADRAGDRRTARARDLAIDLPARSQRRQRDPDGPAQPPSR